MNHHPTSRNEEITCVYNEAKEGEIGKCLINITTSNNPVSNSVTYPTTAKLSQ